MKTKFLFFIALLSVNLFWSQKEKEHKFLDTPKIDINDLKKAKSAIKEDAPAEVLYRSIHYYVRKDFEMEIKIVDRVKIYNKDKAEDYLNKEVSLYESVDGHEEKMSGLKAYTYNLENDKMVTTKVEKDSKFKSTENKRYNIVKFAFPNVKDGSIVEYSYTIVSPFIHEMPRIIIEQDIPVIYMEYVFDAPKELGYSINYKGSLTPKYRVAEEKMLYGTDYRTYRFGYENIQPFLDEKFVKNIDNYKTSVRAELNSTYIGNQFKSYSLSWQDVRKQMMDDDSFGGALKKENLVKDLLPAEIKQIPNDIKRAEAILKFVQKNYTWSKRSGSYVDQGIKNLINTKVGNVAEINILLILLLKSTNINANPVVLSTVDQGLIANYLPSITSLNYVIACIESNDKLYILDATSKLSSINVIPPRAVNYNGFLFTNTDAKQINIVNPEKSNTYLEVNAQLEKDATFTGHFTDRDTKVFAMLNSEAYDKDKDGYQKEYYKDRYKFPLSNLKSGLLNESEFETSFDFDSDTFVDGVGGKLIFNPLLFLFAKNHDFDQTQERKNPIEFLSAYTKNKKVTITIPEGYKFETIPNSKKFKTEDDTIKYSYIVSQEGNKITVEADLLIADSFFEKEYYPAFKQIFDAVTQFEGQLVTVVKK